jgi:hypothetical protein
VKPTKFCSACAHRVLPAARFSAQCGAALIQATQTDNGEHAVNWPRASPASRKAHVRGRPVGAASLRCSLKLLRHTSLVTRDPRTDSQEVDTSTQRTCSLSCAITRQPREANCVRSARRLPTSCATANWITELQSLPYQKRKAQPSVEIVLEVHDASLSYV